MSEFLRQQDIDALMRGDEGYVRPSAESKVISYSFLRPPRVPHHRRKILGVMHDRFALGLQGMLAARLRAPTDVVISSVESLTFAEFKMVLASPCAAFVFRAGSSAGGHGILDFSAPFALHMVDRLLGGPGQSDALSRSLTTLEQGVVRSIAERTLTIMRDAWREHLTIEPEIVRYESDPEMLEIASPDDPILLANFEIRSGGVTGYVTTCFSMDVVDPVLHEQSGPTAADGLTAWAAPAALEESGLKNARVSITARMPACTLSARALAGLKVGQTILTPHFIDGPVEIFVNGRPWFLGTTGQIKNQVGLRIAQSVLGSASRRQGHTREGRVIDGGRSQG